jgi:hypothetical protein
MRIEVGPLSPRGAIHLDDRGADCLAHNMLVPEGTIPLLEDDVFTGGIVFRAITFILFES